MRMVALTEFAEERQPEHVFFCRPFFCDADTSRKSMFLKTGLHYDSIVPIDDQSAGLPSIDKDCPNPSEPIQVQFYST